MNPIFVSAVVGGPLLYLLMAAIVTKIFFRLHPDWWTRDVRDVYGRTKTETDLILILAVFLFWPIAAPLMAVAPLVVGTCKGLAYLINSIGMFVQPNTAVKELDERI